MTSDIAGVLLTSSTQISLLLCLGIWTHASRSTSSLYPLMSFCVPEPSGSISRKFPLFLGSTFNPPHPHTHTLHLLTGFRVRPSYGETQLPRLLKINLSTSVLLEKKGFLFFWWLAFLPKSPSFSSEQTKLPMREQRSSLGSELEQKSFASQVFILFFWNNAAF